MVSVSVWVRDRVKWSGLGLVLGLVLVWGRSLVSQLAGFSLCTWHGARGAGDGRVGARADGESGRAGAGRFGVWGRR